MKTLLCSIIENIVSQNKYYVNSQFRFFVNQTSNNSEEE